MAWATPLPLGRWGWLIWAMTTSPSRAAAMRAATVSAEGGALVAVQRVGGDRLAEGWRFRAGRRGCIGRWRRGTSVGAMPVAAWMAAAPCSTSRRTAPKVPATAGRTGGPGRGPEGCDARRGFRGGTGCGWRAGRRGAGLACSQSAVTKMVAWALVRDQGVGDAPVEAAVAGVEREGDAAAGSGGGAAEALFHLLLRDQPARSVRRCRWRG